MCYAQRNNFCLPSVIKAAETRLGWSREDDFVERMVKAIHARKVKYFRWHSSGDFYSEEYARKALTIMRNCPNTLFRTTTRRRDLTRILRKLNELPNMIVRESLDPFRPIPKMGLPFTALDYMEVIRSRDVYKCTDDCVACGYYCWRHDVNIYFAEF